MAAAEATCLVCGRGGFGDTLEEHVNLCLDQQQLDEDRHIAEDFENNRNEKVKKKPQSSSTEEVNLLSTDQMPANVDDYGDLEELEDIEESSPLVVESCPLVEERVIRKAHSSFIYSITVWNDRLVSGGGDHAIAVWNFDETLHTRVEDAHSGHVWCVSTWGNYLVSGGDDSKMNVWTEKQAADGTPTLAALTTTHAHTADIFVITTWNGNLVSGAKDNSIRIWNFDPDSADYTLKKIADLSGHTETIDGIVVWNGNLASGSWDHDIRIWNDKYECIKVIHAHTESIETIGLVGNYLLSGGYDNAIRMWDEKGECVKEMTGHSAAVKDLHIWGNRLYSASCDHSIRVWTHNGEYVGQVSNQQSTSIFCLAVWRNRLCSSSNDGNIRIYHNKEFEEYEEMINGVINDNDTYFRKLPKDITNYIKSFFLADY